MDRSSRLSDLGYINADRTRTPVRKRLRSRGVPTALQGYELLCTQDRSEALSAVSALVGLATLEIDPESRSEFQATINGIRFLDVSMAYIDFRAASTLSVHQTANAYAVHMPTHLDIDFRIGGHHHSASTYHPVVTNPYDSFMQELEADCPQIIVRIERPALERQLSRMLGRQLEAPVIFHHLADLTSDEAARWHSALQVLSSELMSADSLIGRGIGSSAVEELIISTLLYIQPSNYYEQLRDPHSRRERAAVHRSIEYIEQHLAEAIPMSVLADHTGASVRAIQAGFREDLGTTPVTYIRDRRLDKVRSVLIDGTPADGLTVGSVASRWGFTNPGNFAIHYRRRFGETPSQTLRRGAHEHRSGPAAGTGQLVAANHG